MNHEIILERVINGPVSEVWRVLSDTADLNQKMGLAPMSFETIHGVRHGRQNIMGLELKWTEAPWEWKLHSWIKNERVYSKGFFKSISGTFEFKEITPLETKVRITFSIQHRYPFFAPLLNQGTKSVINKIFAEVEKSIRLQVSGAQSYIRFATFADWLKHAPGMERARIAPKIVARETGKTWNEILKDSLVGEFKNRLSLRFDAVCPHCRGSKKSAPCLTEIPEKVSCDSCEISFSMGTQESVEISLRDLQLPESEVAVDFCSADVAHKPSIIYQRVLQEWSDELLLSEGIYLFKKKGEKNPVMVVADKRATAHEIYLPTLWSEHSQTIRVTPHVRLVSDSSERNEMLMIEAIDNFRGALTASEVLLDSELSRYIPEGILKSDFAMEMGSRSLMFTDVVGSTELYHKVGDTEAFNLVRQSFLFVGETARKYQGTLVKTIGDATMYTFPTPELSVRCAVEMQEKNVSNPIKLRASLHYGPCLSVGTRSGVDFFGDTVNVCAKFQSEAETGQVVLDESMMETLSNDFRITISAGSERIPFKLKGESGREFLLRRISR